VRQWRYSGPDEVGLSHASQLPPRLTIDDVPRPVCSTPNDNKSPAPPVVVACWCGLVGRMDRKHLDPFTRDAGAASTRKYRLKFTRAGNS
jgi:hypothetical protein